MKQENLQELLDKSVQNWNYIQERIDDIKQFDFIDIKQISDLQRYIGMQKDVMSDIALIQDMMRGN